MTEKIPEFDANGLLPVGDYEVTLPELRASILVQGPRDRISIQAGTQAGVCGWWIIWK